MEGASDWIKNDNKKQKKVKQSRQNSGCTWALSGTSRKKAFRTNGRCHGVRFLLHFSVYLFLAPDRPGIPFLAAALNINRVCPGAFEIPECSTR